jgi:BirA family transcriptional regulator, biotin operon repressor / biotin---[acetyl-CoA-carboxylase] ligase
VSRIPGPSATLQGLISGRPLGHPHVHLRKTDSTNDRARELAARGAPHGTLVTAEEQTAGRGRHGRRWSAPPRTALLMSLVVRWPAQRSAPTLLPLAAAVAVCDVIGAQALVKWPNDVVLRRRQTDGPPPGAQAVGSPAHSYAEFAKLAGILIEGRPQERWLVLGIGLNVAVDLADLPPEVQGSAATLGRSSEEIEPTLSALLRALERRLADPPAQILAAWRSRDALIGRQIRWQHGAGRALGISDRGALIVRAEDGSTVELESGEVAPAPSEASR